MTGDDLPPPAGFAAPTAQPRKADDAPGFCEFCPAGSGSLAAHTHTDAQGNVYRLCGHHYQPIRQWKERQRSARRDPVEED